MKTTVSSAPKVCSNLSKQIINSYREGNFLRGIYYIFSDYFYEFKYNISTKCFLDKTEYMTTHPDSIEYVGARFIQLKNIFDKLPIEYHNSSLLDLGCGKGRAIAVAAKHPFLKIIGLEYDPKLALSAQKNITAMRNKISNNIEVVYADAINYDIPKEINVIYMFNPFVGNTLKQVINNIHRSYKAAPRKIHIIFLNHDDFDRAIENQEWIIKITTLAKVDGVNASLYSTFS